MKIRRTARLLSLLFSSVLPCGTALLAQSAGTGAINGRVTTADEGRALVGSKIELGVLPRRFAMAGGGFSFPRLSPGTYRLQIAALGFIPVDTSVQVTRGRTEHVEIRMTALPIELSGMTIRGAAAAIVIPGCERPAYLGGGPAAGSKADPCAPKKPPPECGPVLAVSFRIVICTSPEVLIRTRIVEKKSFFGPNSRVIQAVQTAVAQAKFAVVRFLPTNDRTWLIVAERPGPAMSFDSVRVEVEQVGPDDTTVTVSLDVLKYFNSSKELDYARSVLADTGRHLRR